MRGVRDHGQEEERGRDEGAGEVLFQGGVEGGPEEDRGGGTGRGGQGERAKAAAKKGAEAPVKLTATQGELLKKIGGSEAGYLAEKKAEQRTIDALLERKLIKKGAKDKASGNVNYMISSAGKKHPGFQTGGA